MLDQQTHKQVLIQILKEIYGDMVLRKTIGFKGGTAAMLFYDLPRMSVDLDFDLLVPESEGEVFERLNKQLPQFGRVKDSYQKRHTLQRNVKIVFHFGSVAPLVCPYLRRIYRFDRVGNVANDQGCGVFSRRTRLCVGRCRKDGDENKPKEESLPGFNGAHD